MISASALMANCAYPRVLKAKKPTTPEQELALERGRLFHAAVELWVKGGDLPEANDPEIQGWLNLMASQWWPAGNEEVEIAWGLRRDGSYVDVDEPEPHVYVARDGSELLTAGRADLAMDRKGVLVSVDWKTGRWPVTPAVDNLQVNAAGIALAQLRGLASYVPAIYYVRDGFFDEGDEVPLGSAAHAAIFREIYDAATLDDTPRPGPHCQRCWERRSCASASV